MKTIEAETELKQFAENYSDWLVVIRQSNRTLTEEGEDIFYVAPGTEIVWPECDVDDCPPGLIEAIRKLSKMRKKPFDPESQEILLRNLRQRAPLRPEDLKKLPKADLEWLERSGQVKVVSVKDGEKVYERTVKEGTSWVWPLDGYQSPECGVEEDTMARYPQSTQDDQDKNTPRGKQCGQPALLRRKETMNDH